MYLCRSKSLLSRIAELLQIGKEEEYLRERRCYCAWQHQSTGRDLLLGFTKPLFSHLQYSQSECRKIITHNWESHWLVRCEPPWQSYLLKYLSTYLFGKKKNIPATFELVQSFHFTFTLFQFWSIIVNNFMEILRNAFVAADCLS